MKTLHNFCRALILDQIRHYETHIATQHYKDLQEWERSLRSAITKPSLLYIADIPALHDFYVDYFEFWSVVQMAKIKVMAQAGGGYRAKIGMFYVSDVCEIATHEYLTTGRDENLRSFILDNLDLWKSQKV